MTKSFVLTTHYIHPSYFNTPLVSQPHIMHLGKQFDICLMSSSHMLHVTAHGELCSEQAPLLTEFLCHPSLFGSGSLWPQKVVRTSDLSKKGQR